MAASKINFKAVMAAVGTGAGYELAIQGAAKKVDFVNENYLVTKSLVAGMIGSGLLYFGKQNDEVTKASGYAFLGVGGAAGASKVSSLIVTSGQEQMNGTFRQNLRAKLNRKRPQTDAIRRKLFNKGGAGREMSEMRPGMPAAGSNRVGIDYTQMAYADLIYPQS